MESWNDRITGAAKVLGLESDVLVAVLTHIGVDEATIKDVVYDDFKTEMHKHDNIRVLPGATIRLGPAFKLLRGEMAVLGDDTPLPDLVAVVIAPPWPHTPTRRLSVAGRQPIHRTPLLDTNPRIQLGDLFRNRFPDLAHRRRLQRRRRTALLLSPSAPWRTAPHAGLSPAACRWYTRCPAAHTRSGRFHQGASPTRRPPCRLLGMA